MDKLERGNINLEPLYTFFTNDLSPLDFAWLLDEFLYNYIIILIESYADEEIGIHEDTTNFIYYIKLLRDIVPLCGKEYGKVSKY